VREFRVAVLYASVGTGHKTAALALTRWFQAEFPEVKTVCLDTLAYSSPLVRGIYTRSYLEMVRRAPQLWGYFYESMEHPESQDGLLSTLNELAEKLNLTKLRLSLESFAPDIILFTHFFGTSAVMSAFPGIPVYYVNTDFLSHIFHRNRAFSGWFVASDEAIRQCAADGLDMNRVVFSGIPVDPAYCFPPGREEARQRLGIGGSAPSVLVVSGGIGVGPIEGVVESLVRQDGMDVFAICGRNEELAEALKVRFEDEPRVRVEGFVNGLLDWYCASDLIIMKPGGLCSSEALALGKPILIMDPIPGQEQRNSDVLLDHGAARTLLEYRAAGDKARAILDNPAELARLREGTRRLGKPTAGRTVVRTLAAWHGIGPDGRKG
jgi:processive 1,2-diacylglycerol beta-glucosyltransferase